MMKSLSVGVSSTGCLVNSLSKLEVSRLSLCQMESRHVNTEGNATERASHGELATSGASGMPLGVAAGHA